LKTDEKAEQVKEVLWEDWDPIGVNGFSGAEDEYDSYAEEILSIARQTHSANAVAEHLVAIEYERMGLFKRNTSKVMSVAEKILKLAEKQQ
jgi:hypothetical protein